MHISVTVHVLYGEWATFKRSNKNKSAEKLIRDNLVLKCCSWPQNPCFWRANQAKSETFVWWCDFISVYFSVIMCLSQLMWKLCCIIKLLLKRVKGLFCKKVQIWVRTRQTNCGTVSRVQQSRWNVLTDSTLKHLHQSWSGFCDLGDGSVLDHRSSETLPVSGQMFLYTVLCWNTCYCNTIKGLITVVNIYLERFTANWF